MSIPEHLIRDLPDPEAAVRFFELLSTDEPLLARKLLKNDALLSDTFTLVSYSPLLSTTILQNPEYLWWLNRRRVDRGVRGKEEMLESLARFSLTHSQLDLNVRFARFRRRELLRIYLADIRRQLTIAEVTEEVSNLADAVLESALRIARQEMDNRYGAPFEIDENGRKKLAEICVVSLGKLGSRELNYSSDIDLLFIYSGEGETSGSGSRGQITAREYFIKLAEHIIRIIGQQTGEGATYRVDLRLRPHGRVGPLAMSVRDTAEYYRNEAADWERQVLIRSRTSAGEAQLFERFFAMVESSVFSESQSIASALGSVRRSKQKIDWEHNSEKGFDAKLGKGGIREIEFIAQALQLAYGGRDRWLRASHTLISLSRLADREHISKEELTLLYDAYEFLRRLEHILQMEHGLQTHLVPSDTIRRAMIARRMRFTNLDDFDATLERHTSDVHGIFRRVFSDENIESATFGDASINEDRRIKPGKIVSVDDNAGISINKPVGFSATNSLVEKLISVSPKFASLLQAHNALDEIEADAKTERDFRSILFDAVKERNELGIRLAALRTQWFRLIVEIAALDATRSISTRESKRRQTLLAEAAINAGLDITRHELAKRFGMRIESLELAVMGLGKLGGAGIDYDSDLDLVMVYDDSASNLRKVADTEFFGRAVGIFVNVLSGVTREGSLYRVDLRLRPYGNNGPGAISRRSFAEYVRTEAAIWEMLAFLKIRNAGGVHRLAAETEEHITKIILQRAKTIPREDLAHETRRVRLRLEKERSLSTRRGEIDIKYGSGGMLDIYFTIRYLQLRDGISDDPANRSSDFVLQMLLENGSLTKDEHSDLLAGYEFLSELDHSLRLTVGRSTLLPSTNSKALDFAAERMGIEASTILMQQLAVHRIAIRDAFESVLASK